MLRKALSIAFAALLAAPAWAQSEPDDLERAYKACLSHAEILHKGGIAIPSWHKGWESCATIGEAWKASEPGRKEAERKAKDEADRALVEQLAKKLGR